MKTYSRTRSFVFMSDLLFEKISKKVVKVLPPQNFKRKTFVSVVGRLEAGDGGERGELVFIYPAVKNGRVSLLSTSLRVEEIIGERVLVKIMFPYLFLGVTSSHRDKIIKAYLDELGLGFLEPSVADGEIMLEVNLSFTPVETYIGVDRNSGQKIFICPEEI